MPARKQPTASSSKIEAGRHAGFLSRPAEPEIECDGAADHEPVQELSDDGAESERTVGITDPGRQDAEQAEHGDQPEPVSRCQGGTGGRESQAHHDEADHDRRDDGANPPVP